MISYPDFVGWFQIRAFRDDTVLVKLQRPTHEDTRQLHPNPSRWLFQWHAAQVIEYLFFLSSIFFCLIFKHLFGLMDFFFRLSELSAAAHRWQAGQAYDAV